jgi:hypothetical protein
LITASPLTVVRGQPIVLSWSIRTDEEIRLTRLSASGTAANPAWFSSLLYSTDAESVGQDDNVHTFEYSLPTDDLPLGESQFVVWAWAADGSYLDVASRPTVDVSIIPAGEPTESAGPTISFLSVSEPVISVGAEVTIRWTLTDQSGTEQVTWGNGYATGLILSCPGMNTYVVHGSLQSGDVYDGAYEATVTGSDYLADRSGSCDLKFAATDVWGNWNRLDEGEALSVGDG